MVESEPKEEIYGVATIAEKREFVNNSIEMFLRRIKRLSSH